MRNTPKAESVQIEIEFGAVIPLGEFSNLQPRFAVKYTLADDAPDTLMSDQLKALQMTMAKCIVPVVDSQLSLINKVQAPETLVSNLTRTHPTFAWLHSTAPDLAQGCANRLLARINQNKTGE